MFEDRLGVFGCNQQTSSANQFLQVPSTMGCSRQTRNLSYRRFSRWKSCYRTLMSDPARFLEIVYDPTIGEACLKFDHIFRRPHWMYLSITRKGRVREVLRNWPV